jgi:uncharacterized tellurite resistance protein B-like protein
MFERLEGLMRISFRDRRRRPPDMVPQDLKPIVCLLLLEVARADGDLFPCELRRLQHLACRQLGLDIAEVKRLLERVALVAPEAIDVTVLTFLLRQRYSLAQRRILIGTLRDVAESDGQVARQEDYLLRRVGWLLRLSPQDGVESGR